MSLRPDTSELGNAQLTAEDCEILHAKSGDCDAFTPLMRRHYCEVLGVAVRHAPTAHLGEDIASEAFTFAWQNFDRFTLGGDFGAWVRTIAWQLARARRNREESRQRQLERYTEHCDLGDTPAALDRIRQRAAAVLDVLSTVHPERKKLVLLCDYDGLTYEEAAADLGRSAAWVRTNLHRTRHQIRAASSELQVL
jgi:RNA polymerase sigma-70 factor (ECF subfamily)